MDVSVFGLDERPVMRAATQADACPDRRAGEGGGMDARRGADRRLPVDAGDG
ncbi:hypothetical protein [Burkholderia ubonensis]|uniref:hypothetical protein n=1 Tax=Burkholderia ubonensis TaxID=101571 RepID=UPI000B2DBCEB|nr:hypothetical protein [Burkholderia ubonensis]